MSASATQTRRLMPAILGPMTLSEIATLADIVNTIVVTLTFIVLIISIRQNTQSQRVVAVQSLTAAITAINVPAMDSPALGTALLNVTRNWQSASRDERIIAHYFLFSYFKLVEQAWYQHQTKVLDNAQWVGWERGVRLFYHSPGVKSVWWPNRHNAYSAEFQAHLASTSAEGSIGALNNIFDPAPTSTSPAPHAA